LRPSGRPSGALAAELRSIPNLRSIGTVASAWGQLIGVIAFGAWADHPMVWVLVVLAMSRAFSLLAILTHEAAHRLLFSHARVNDLVGTWVLGAPAFVPFLAYRRSHLAHHRDEFGPDEPDLGLYSKYPIAKASMRRKLTRDALGASGRKNLLPLFAALGKASSRPVALKIVAVQLVIATVLTVVGSWWWYPVLWLLPWMTGWRVINRLRSIAEHGGMTRSPDRRETTHHVRQSVAARLIVAPYCTGWHLAHHMDQNVPWSKLPRYHAELEAAGWVDEAITWPNYRTLWRALASG